MSFQPPPPPPGGAPPPPPPPPPPGQWGPPPGGGQPGFNPSSVNPLDWALLGIGAILFLFSFFEYYSVSAGGFSASDGAWHFSSGSFIGWFAFLFGLAAAVVVALGIFMPAFKLPVANYVAAVGLFGVSTLLYIIGFFAIGPDDSACGGISACENAIDNAFSFGFSYWLSFIAVIAGAVLALMRAQQTGAALPGPLASIPTIGGGKGGSTPPPGPGAPPPPPGYGPPQ